MQGVYSIEFVLPAVMGGMGFVSGPLLGSLLLIPLSEFLRANLGGKIPGANLIVYAWC
jgi:branched-chain amino acid transport system permease protein